MTLEDYSLLLESPESVDEEALQPLQDLLQYAPYCVSARLLLLKALYNEGRKKEASSSMQRAMLAAPQEVSVYFLLHPKPRTRATKPAERPTAQGLNPLASGPKSLTYFEMIDRMQAVARKRGITFEELTKRYLEARQYTRQNG